MTAGIHLPTTYFEKTIEWAYVLSQLKDNFGAPLDGDHEKAGDALASSGSKLIVIEFKRTKDGITREKDKYISMKKIQGRKTNEEIKTYKAFRRLYEKALLSQTSKGKSKAPPHAFVYGNEKQATIDGKPVKVLEGLAARRYWGSWANNHYYLNDQGLPTPSMGADALKDDALPQPTVGEIIEKLGCNGGLFKKYILDLVTAKGGEAATASGDWMYATVAGTFVTIDGTIAFAAMSVWDYAHINGMHDLCLAFAERDAQLAQQNANNYPDSPSVASSDTSRVDAATS